jgi:hypothetical protein
MILMTVIMALIMSGSRIWWRGADVRPDFHWDKPPVAAMGYR